MKLQKADLLVLLASLFWGINFSSVKIALLYVPPMVMGMLRFAIAGTALLIALKIIHGHIRITWPLLRLMLFVGAVGFGIQQLCFLSGARLIDASLSALLTTFTTAIMTIVASLVTREPLTRLMCMGIGIACVGMLLVVIGKGDMLAVNPDNWLGMALMLVSGIIAGSMPLFVKSALKSHSSLQVTTWSIVIGSFFFLPLGAFNTDVTTLIQVPLPGWLAICFTALGATAFATILWNHCIAHIGVVRMAIYGYLPPILGVLLATLFLRESMTWLQWGGALLTLVGVAVSQYQQFMHVAQVKVVPKKVKPVAPKWHIPTFRELVHHH